MKKQKIIIVLLLVLFILLAFSVTCLADTSLEEMISLAVSANGNHPNVVILRNGGMYYTLASVAPYDVNQEGNWIYREYKGEYGLTSPGWYRIHGQYSPFHNWWSASVNYSFVNSIGSNSFFQLSGDFSSFEIVYAWRNILNEDGSIYYLAYGGKVASIIVKNKIDFDFLIEEIKKLFPVIIKAIITVIGLCIAVKLIGRTVKGV